jgi:hypothetical protein
MTEETQTFVTGKWTCSTNEEHFDCSESFDTEAEAIEYGKHYCEEMGIEDGDLYYTGQIDAVTVEEMVNGAPDSDRVIESIDMFLYDNLGEVAEGGLSVPAAAQADLDERLRTCVKDWIIAHSLVPNWCHIERLKSHVFHQCDVVDETQGGPSSTARCARVMGHEGEHDFP